uniref:Uncharacterized protein n=1 Tax=Mycena chlorophos TaxID=658473 RepID=A0ABQ0LTU2_MYCCL|nr:predicted protein [Mycena chlorophos]
MSRRWSIVVLGLGRQVGRRLAETGRRILSPNRVHVKRAFYNLAVRAKWAQAPVRNVPIGRSQIANDSTLLRFAGPGKPLGTSSPSLGLSAPSLMSHFPTCNSPLGAGEPTSRSYVDAELAVTGERPRLVRFGPFGGEKPFQFDFSLQGRTTHGELAVVDNGQNIPLSQPLAAEERACGREESPAVWAARHNK